MSESENRPIPFIIYLLVFHALWMGGYVFWIYPWMQSLGDTTLAYALINISLRLLVWVLPVFLYLHFIDHVDPLVFLKLKENWKRGLLFGLGLSLFIFLGSLLRYGAPAPGRPLFTWNSFLSSSILIGFIEEIPYRGFILQKFEQLLGFWRATLIASVLFLGIHLPGWIVLHLLTTYNVISVFLFGIVMAIELKVGKSLWGPIVTHSLNDFISVVLFRL
jgi:membrane protease YdiL (CAAX protease family)